MHLGSVPSVEGGYRVTALCRSSSRPDTGLGTPVGCRGCGVGEPPGFHREIADRACALTVNTLATINGEWLCEGHDYLAAIEGVGR